MKVLLLVDIQNDFCPGGALAVDEGDQVVAVANRLMSSGHYDLILATKDFHPSEHKSFAENHPGQAIGEVVDLNGLPQRLWPVHCVEGSHGAEFHPELDATRIDHVVLKGRDIEVDSYSGFFDNGHRNKTNLDQIIQVEAQKRGVEQENITIDCMGLALDYCVKFTALDAAKTLNYNTSIILDGCRAVNISPGDDVTALKEMSAAGIEVTESRVIVPEVNQRPREERPIELLR